MHAIVYSLCERENNIKLHTGSTLLISMVTATLAFHRAAHIGTNVDRNKSYVMSSIFAEISNWISHLSRTRKERVNSIYLGCDGPCHTMHLIVLLYFLY